MADTVGERRSIQERAWLRVFTYKYKSSRRRVGGGKRVRNVEIEQRRHDDLDSVSPT